MDTRCNGELTSKFHFAYGTPRCQRKGTVERKGVWYCRLHDPIASEQREEIRRKQWQELRDSERKAIREQKLRIEAGDMGIELAKFITVSGWKDYDVSVAWNKAHAILDKLEGK